MVKNLSSLFLLVSVATCVGSCQIAKEKSPDTESSNSSEMIARTNEAIERHHAHEYTNKNNARAEHLTQLMAKAEGMKRVELRMQRANELLLSGQTEVAIQELEELCSMMANSQYGLTPNTRIICDMLGLAYLRLGEEENCCANHNPESCLFPLRGQAIHTRTRGSERAIQVYLKLLELFPDDIQTKYLLNIAYMTLGQYDSNVIPAQHFLPGFDKPSAIPFPEFSEIAIKTKSDIMGLCGGVCLEDFNGDGLLDIMASSYGLHDQLRYLENNGSDGFSDKTEAVGLIGIESGLNLIHADYDNDGDNDVLLLRGAWLNEFGDHPNSLIRNNGDGTFTDVTLESGLYSEHPSQTACWADLNNDGWLDLFIGNESQSASGVNHHPSELFMSNKDGTFTEVAAKAGIDHAVYAKGCAAADFNSDGRMDIYVSNYQGDNLLYKNIGDNLSGIPQFINVAQQANVTGPQESFPCWFFDFDNDGNQDLFVSDYSNRGFQEMAGEVAAELTGKQGSIENCKLYRNSGDGTFEDVTAQAGLDLSLFAMGCNFGDLNNDGYLDFYIGNGAPDLRMIIPNRVFVNQGGKTFVDVTTNGRFGNLQKGHGVGFGDVDNDGDQDLYIVMGGAVEGDTYQNLLFENPGWEHDWLQLILEGTNSNRSAIGAQVAIAVNDKDGKERWLHRVVGTGGSFGASSLRMEVGLGNCEKIGSVTVTWPNGTMHKEEFTGIQPNKHYHLIEGTGKAQELKLNSVNF